MFASTEFWFPLKKYAFQQTKPTLPHIQQLYWKGGGGVGGGRTITIKSMKDRNNLTKRQKKFKDTKSFQKSVINTLLERRKETDKFGTPFQILY